MLLLAPFRELLLHMMDNYPGMLQPSGKLIILKSSIHKFLPKHTKLGSAGGFVTFRKARPNSSPRSFLILVWFVPFLVLPSRYRFGSIPQKEIIEHIQ